MKTGKKRTKKFARLVEKAEKIWKPVSEVLEAINLGAKHDKK
jgi:hypothetical protein